MPRARCCPPDCPSNPTYRKVNPADAPIMILSLTSETMTRGQLYDAASSILAQKLSQIDGIGQVTIGGSSLPAVRVELITACPLQVRHRHGRRAQCHCRGQCEPAQRHGGGRRTALADLRQRPGQGGGRLSAADRRLPQRRRGASVGRRRSNGFGPGPAQRRIGQRQARRARHPEPAAGGEHHRDRGPGQGDPATC